MRRTTCLRTSQGAEMAAEAGKGKAKKGEALSQEKIITQFQQMRQEQRSIANKIAELEGEETEHRLVIEALKAVDPERRCFRMVGGVLVERTVQDVQPALEHNREQMRLLMTKLKEQLEAKGRELNAFKLKHNIRFGNEDKSGDKPESSDTSKTSGVLVS